MDRVNSLDCKINKILQFVFSSLDKDEAITLRKASLAFQQINTCSKATTKTLEKGVKYVHGVLVSLLLTFAFENISYVQ